MGIYNLNSKLYKLQGKKLDINWFGEIGLRISSAYKPEVVYDKITEVQEDFFVVEKIKVGKDAGTPRKLIYPIRCVIEIDLTNLP